MRTLFIAAVSFIGMVASVSAAGLTQTFEPGEDTSNWGSSWNNGTVVGTFLDSSLGGLNAGSGDSSQQTFSRSFRNNTAGVDVAAPYSIGLYLQISALTDGADSGQFEFMDGEYGLSGAHIRVQESSMTWEAWDGTDWVSLGMNLSLANPYYVEFNINPTTYTYSVIVQQVTASGTVLDTAQLSNLAFDSGVVTNGKNGQITLYLQASAGAAGVAIDNINVQGIPEPSTAILLVLGGLAIMARRFHKPT